MVRHLNDNCVQSHYLSAEGVIAVNLLWGAAARAWSRKIPAVAAAAILILLVSGCGSSYLAARKALITEKMGTNENGKTRTELEKRWGKPVWERTEADGTVACTYEYNALADAWLDPLDNWKGVTGASGEVGTLWLILSESTIFPYYLGKDLVVRERYRAKVIYDANGIATFEMHYKIDDAVPVPEYQPSPKVRDALAAGPYRKMHVDSFIATVWTGQLPRCVMEVSPLLPVGEASMWQYLRGALNREFEEAGIYDPAGGVALVGDLLKARVRPTGVISGSIWQFTLALDGPEEQIARVETEYLCEGRSSCREMAECFPAAIAAAFTDLVRSTGFCANMASEPASCPPAVAVEPPASAASQIDAQAPWTGRWKVSSGVLGGTWILKQTGSTVLSAPESSYKLEASVDGNTIRGTWEEQGQHPRDFKATLSEDGMSFNAQAFYWTSVYFTAKRTD